jgi:hypothetical protein
MPVLLALLLFLPACLASPESFANKGSEPKRCDWGVDTAIRSQPGMSALVLGGTGAVGRCRYASFAAAVAVGVVGLCCLACTAAATLVGSRALHVLNVIKRTVACNQHNSSRMQPGKNWCQSLQMHKQQQQSAASECSVFMSCKAVPPAMLQLSCKQHTALLLLLVCL